jgi:hypothetical protein
MKKLIISGVILAAASSSLFAAVVTVNGMSNVFEAGLGNPGDSVGPNMGNFATLAASFSAGAGQTISFNSITGTTLCGNPCGTNSTGIAADGSSTTGLLSGATSITSTTGISGISFSRQMFLIGVFLDGNTPVSGAADAGLTFATSGGGLDTDNRVNWFDPSTTFAIGQTFYIGDGRTGFCQTSAACAGTLQVWNIPTTATRLFLGFADGGSIGPFSGAFGAYNDNSTGVGLTVDVNTSGLAGVPEPGTIMLMGLGLAAIGLIRKRIA